MFDVIIFESNKLKNNKIDIIGKNKIGNGNQVKVVITKIKKLINIKLFEKLLELKIIYYFFFFE